GEHLAVHVQPAAAAPARRRADLPRAVGGGEEAHRADARPARPGPGGRGEAAADRLRGGAAVHRVVGDPAGRRRGQPDPAAVLTGGGDASGGGRGDPSGRRPAVAVHPAPRRRSARTTRRTTFWSVVFDDGGFELPARGPVDDEGRILV